MTKVTKAQLVAEARRVFGDVATVYVDVRSEVEWSYTCFVELPRGVQVMAGANEKARARRRLYDALMGLQAKAGVTSV